MIKDLRYLVAYINPMLAAIGLLIGEAYAWSAVIFSFLVIPILDQISHSDTQNYTEIESQNLNSKRVFDWLLYLNIPITYGIIALFIVQLNSSSMSLIELIGHILSVGIVIGTCGINVAHELGHRPKKYQQRLGQLLLVPALYAHFFVEHNHGHHRYVATSNDPSTAAKGEWLFSFWFKSISGCFIGAWKIEAKRLHKAKISFWSAKNQMIQFMLVQAIYLFMVYSLSSLFGLFVVVLCGFVGVLLLESINYIEHYGLQRKKMSNGRYERVRPIHSWNANYYIGRIALYELTRHSDHHYRASKKYQTLEHHKDAPELPFGYPAMILIALLPPLWFNIMNKRLPN